MRDLRWPTEVRGKGNKAATAASWLNRLLAACKMGTITGITVVGGTGKLEATTEGTNLVIDPKGTPGESPAPMHPFKIYQPTNVSDFTTGFTFLGTDGTATVCNIDATKPTDFTTVPPTVNPSESWRFWAVRTGKCSVRPIYSMPSSYYGLVNYSEIVDVTENADTWVGNYISSYDDPLTTTAFPPLISSAPLSNPSVWGGLALWIQITPDTSDVDYLTVAIAGAKIQSGENPGSSTPVFPAGPNVIPIGIVWTPGSTDGNASFVEQFLFDHATNRFPPGNGNFGSGGVMNFRGTYETFDASTAPDDLADQVFYPGDVVVVTNSDPDNPSITRELWQFNYTTPYTWSIPGPSSDWAQIL